MQLEILRGIFEEVVNNFYKKGVTVSLDDSDDTAYCSGDHIVLPRPLLENFSQQHLPRFTVLYHELGHALYSHTLHSFIDKWQNLPTQHNAYAYDPRYFHLLNWIEDLYIEDQMVKNYSFLKDIIGCLKRLTPDYDILEIDKAFHHYYVKGYASPTLTASDSLIFKSYLSTLLSLREKPGFGKGPISLLSSKSNETQFIRTLIEFYNWCVSKQIFDHQMIQPPLSNPMNTTAPGPGQGSGQGPNQKGQGGQGSSISNHSHIVGEAVEVIPKFDPQEVAIFSEQFAAEQKLIKTELARQHSIESRQNSLDGLFNSLFIDTSIIQSKVIVPNFFNPNRLIDQVLFKRPDKSFNNVSIYRDISGSTEGKRHKLINDICKYLDSKLPIAYNFYLYSSGDISILQTTFEDWEDDTVVPDVYSDDPIFEQMTGGTNSGAIADVITEQLNDKWLNIIITDGDLSDLMHRDNINSLLENVFVISVDNSSYLDDVPNKIIINEEEEISGITQAILNMRGAI